MILEESYGKGVSRDCSRRRSKRLKLFQKQDGKCHWCTQPMDLEPIRVSKLGNIKCNQAYATFEHVRPKSMGGDWWSKDNIVLAHASCNNKRHKRRWPHDPIYGRGKHHDKT